MFFFAVWLALLCIFGALHVFLDRYLFTSPYRSWSWGPGFGMDSSWHCSWRLKDVNAYPGVNNLHSIFDGKGRGSWYRSTQVYMLFFFFLKPCMHWYFIFHEAYKDWRFLDISHVNQPKWSIKKRSREPGISELLFVSAKRMSRIPNCHQLMDGRPQVTFQLICATETGMGDWQTDGGIGKRSMASGKQYFPLTSIL